MHSICSHYETPAERLGTRDAHLDIASWMEQWQECARMQALKASRPTILLGSQHQHICFMQELMSNSSWSILDITVQMESGHTNAQALNNKKIFRILLCSKKPKNGSCPSLSTSVDTESPVSSSSLIPSNSFLDTSKSTYLMHSQSQKKQMVENLQHMFNLTNCSGVCINVNIQ